MLKAERADRIYEIIKERKHVTVEELVNMLHYSPATVRRDITYLANLGVVNKSYGGVSINGARPMIVREHENTAGKIRLCNRASEMVREGDMVFVDATTTTYFLCEALAKKKNVTVVTPNMKLATFLGEKKVRCFVLGGQVFDSTMLVGPHTAEMVRKFFFDVAFFSVGAISQSGEIAMSENMWTVNRIAAENSQKNVLLCDGSKFNYRVRISCGDLSKYDTMVSDEEIPKELIDNFPSVEFIIA